MTKWINRLQSSRSYSKTEGPRPEVCCREQLKKTKSDDGRGWRKKQERNPYRNRLFVRNRPTSTSVQYPHTPTSPICPCNPLTYPRGRRIRSALTTTNRFDALPPFPLLIRSQYPYLVRLFQRDHLRVWTFSHSLVRL